MICIFNSIIVLVMANTVFSFYGFNASSCERIGTMAFVIHLEDASIESHYDEDTGAHAVEVGKMHPHIWPRLNKNMMRDVFYDEPIQLWIWLNNYEWSKVDRRIIANNGWYDKVMLSVVDCDGDIRVGAFDIGGTGIPTVIALSPFVPYKDDTGVLKPGYIVQLKEMILLRSMISKLEDGHLYKLEIKIPDKYESRMDPAPSRISRMPYYVYIRPILNKRDKAIMYCRLGYWNKKDGKYAEAKQYYMKSIETDPNLMCPLEGMYSLCRMQHNYVEAMEFLAQLDQIAPETRRKELNRWINDLKEKIDKTREYHPGNTQER